MNFENTTELKMVKIDTFILKSTYFSVIKKIIYMKKLTVSCQLYTNFIEHKNEIN